MNILLVLFGQENDTDGKLRLPAAMRCAKAVEVYRELSRDNRVMVLPTGGFGPNFNVSDQPHSSYMTRELVKLGIPESNIYAGTNSSNTVQDATEAWYLFKREGFERLVAITSDYHAERVAFILSRLSTNDNAEIEVVPADTPAEYKGVDKQQEAEKVDHLKKEWVEVIRRSAEVPPGRFVAVYQDAGREHQHYETISWAAVAALLIVNGFAFLIVPGKTGLLLVLLLLLFAVIDLVLWLLYDRMADAARMARYVLNRMEIEHRLPGFSSNWRTTHGEWYRMPPWQWSIRDLVAALTITLFLTLAVLSLVIATDTKNEKVETRASSSIANSATASPTPISGSNGNALDRWSNSVLSSQDNSNSNTNTRDRRRR